MAGNDKTGSSNPTPPFYDDPDNPTVSTVYRGFKALQKLDRNRLEPAINRTFRNAWSNLNSTRRTSQAAPKRRAKSR